MKLELGHGLTLYLGDPDCPLLEFKVGDQSGAINLNVFVRTGIVGDVIQLWLEERAEEAQDNG